MRAALIASCLLVPTLAQAQAAPRSIDWNHKVIDKRAGGPKFLTNVSHTLYLNNCLPNGCTVQSTQNTDSSVGNQSSIPRASDGVRTLSAWAWGDELWNDVVQCVVDTFKPFDITVVTDDPSPGNHHEVMVAGTAIQLRPGLEAGGIAPFIACDASEENTLTFVFAQQTNDVQYLCGAIAHEAGHAWGLTHLLHADDPMTYLELGSLKRFQNESSQCGEALSNPYQCECTGSTQNSFDYLRDTFGLNPNIGPAALTIATPADGRWVGPGFPITAAHTSELLMMRAQLEIDDVMVGEIEGFNALAWNAPDDLEPGPHTIKVSVTDLGDRTVTAMTTINLAKSCAGGCPSGTTCINDVCAPGADQPGGLGSPCGGNDECVTGTCSSDGESSLCTGACGADGTCPGGFACVTAVNTCWPDSSGGGCTSSGNATAPFLLLVLGGLFLGRRRRAARR